MKLLLAVFLIACLVDFSYAVRLNNWRNNRKDFNYHKKASSKSKIKIVNYALKQDDQFKIVSVGAKDLKIQPFKDWTAKAVFNGNDYNSTGWSVLEIETNEEAKDCDQAYSAGLLEGQTTRDLINLHLVNMVGDFCDQPSTSCSSLVEFLQTNFRWLNSQIAQHKDDPYWHHVNLVFHQFYGLYHGYYNLNYTLSENLLEVMSGDVKPYLKLLALQLNGDIGELFASFAKVSNPFMAGSCSALIKVLPNNADLFTSHVTWTVYESMLRVLKHYKFHYHFNDIDPSVVPGYEMSFSSYPGTLTSIDDFYVLNTKLVVLETTIGNSNPDLWKYVTPQTNLYWVRNMIANRLSVTGADWAKWFSLYNSGTYNNEWMVVDYKEFVPGEPLRDGLFTVLEQMPGQTVWSDQTDVLRSQSYWPSYNIAFYPYVYNITGTYDAFVKYGSFFSYEESPRASIFRRDQHNVVDIDSMIKMMRYNDYKKDPLSACDCNPPYSGENTISARSDLNPADGTYPFDALGHRDHGATDMKMTNFEMSRNLEFIGICGPTFDDNNDIPAFVWSQADFGNSTNHFGHPDKWNFDPLHVKWVL